MSLIFVDLLGSIGQNNYDTKRISQLKIVKLCTRTMSFSVILVHIDVQAFFVVCQTALVFIESTGSFYTFFDLIIMLL